MDLVSSMMMPSVGLRRAASMYYTRRSPRPFLHHSFTCLSYELKEEDVNQSLHRSARFNHLSSRHSISDIFTATKEIEQRTTRSHKPSRIPIPTRSFKCSVDQTQQQRQRSASCHGLSVSDEENCEPTRSPLRSIGGGHGSVTFSDQPEFLNGSETSLDNQRVQHQTKLPRSKTEQNIRGGKRLSEKGVQLRRCISLYERKRKPHYCKDHPKVVGDKEKVEPNHSLLRRKGKVPTFRMASSDRSESVDSDQTCVEQPSRPNSVQKKLRGPSPLHPSIERSSVVTGPTPSIRRSSTFTVRNRTKSESESKIISSRSLGSTMNMRRSASLKEKRTFLRVEPSDSIPSTPSSLSLDMSESIASTLSCPSSPTAPTCVTPGADSPFSTDQDTVLDGHVSQLTTLPISSELTHDSASTAQTPTLLSTSSFCCSQVFVPETEDGYPPVCPPHNKRSDIYNPKEFSVIDQHAIQAPSDLAKDFDLLIEYLIECLDSDVGKLRAIFRWLTSQVPPLTSKVKDVSEDSPAGFLIRIGKKKATYPELFAALCRRAEIPCVIVNGVAKSVAYDVGDRIKHKRMASTWNAVYVEDSWRLVHPYWASYFPKGNCSGNWALVESDDFYKDDDGQPPKKQLDRKSCNDFYFLTDPEKFISKCLPEDPDWQLLARPISELQFENSPFLQPPFHQLHLRLVSHDACLLFAEDGSVEVKIAYPAEKHKRYKFKYRLYLHRDWEAEGIYEPRLLDRYLFHYCHENIAVFDIRFPISGDFRLELHCEDTKHKLHSDWICDFKIWCKQPMADCEPLPLVPAIGWGPGKEMQEAGVECLSHDHCVVSLDGEAVNFMRFALPKSNNIELEAELVSNDKSAEELADSVECEKEDGHAVIRISTPTTGEFALRVYAKESGQDTRRNICNYLLKRTQLVEDPEFADIRRELLLATDSGSVETLSHWIDQFVDKDMNDLGELVKAKKKLQVARLNRDLSEAIARKDLDLLEKAMGAASDTSLRRHLGHLHAEAEAMRSRLRRLKRLRHAVLEMEQKTISEIRSYPKPPPPVHGVMAATFLMLGNKEADVKKWRTIQGLISKRGKDSLKRRVAEFNMNNVSSSALNRVRKILAKYDLEIVQIASAGAATFYQWAISMTTEIEMESKSAD